MPLIFLSILLMTLISAVRIRDAIDDITSDELNGFLGSSSLAE
jgi:hypothetical protein